MALIGLRGGGEHGNLAAWTLTVAALTRDATVILSGMGGPASIKHSGSATGQSRFLFSTADQSTVYFRFKFMVVSTAAPATAYTLRYTFVNTVGVLGAGFRLTHNTDGTFSLCAINSGNADVGAVYTGNPFIAGQTHSISGRFVAGPANNGTIEVRIDGVTVVLQTTVLTATASTNVPGTVAGFQLTTLSVHNRVTHYGDWLFDDADYPLAGATVIARQFKAGTPTYDQFALVGGGTKPANISESPPSATLAIAGSLTTAEEAQTALINSFSAVETGKGAGIIPAGANILGVRVEAWVKANNVTTAGAIGFTRLRLGGVNTDAQVAALTIADTFRFGAVQIGVALVDLNSGEAGWVKPTTSLTRFHTVEDMWVAAAYAEAAAAITGTLAAVETGVDVLAASLGAIVTGTLSAAEAGTDTASLTLRAAATGILAAQELGADTASISGSLGLSPIAGSLAAIESGTDTAAIAGTIRIAAALAATEAGADVSVIVLEAAIVGALAVNESGQDVADISMRQRPVEANIGLRGSLAHAARRGTVGSAHLTARHTPGVRLRGSI